MRILDLGLVGLKVFGHSWVLKHPSRELPVSSPRLLGKYRNRNRLSHPELSTQLLIRRYFRSTRVLQSRTINKSDEEVLDRLRALLAAEGRLSLNLIKNAREAPSPSSYRLGLGSSRRAYDLIGYGCPHQCGPIDLRRRTQALSNDLIAQIAGMSPDVVSIGRRGGRWRSLLRLY